jgi:osmoprotectant transport system permease protein
VIVVVLLFFFLFGEGEARAAPVVKVGSKRFTESYVLAEIVKLRAEQAGIAAVHEQGLGATAVVLRALRDGAIDVYPEYTGTLAETAVAEKTSPDLASLRAALSPLGLSISEPIGFQDRYALAVREDLPFHTISDLTSRPDLRFGLSHEFVGRTDGWPGLAARYGLHPEKMSAMDHALTYEAIAAGTIDVMDVYTTDAKIPRYKLRVLDDDRRFFPPYEAVLVYRSDLVTRVPAFTRVLDAMKGSLDETAMRRLNARVELDGAPPDVVAKDALSGTTTASARPSLLSLIAGAIAKHGPRHVELVVVALLLSTLVGIPLGILASGSRRTGAIVLGVTNVVQTIPSLALFCFFIPLLGIGPVPALAALFLYGILPIVQNTHAGLASIPGDLREAAIALGLSPRERLVHVELPLAARTIVAGVKTSAVVAVGSATIAAFIGAGGFGEPISTGLSLNDVPTILAGAIPAAGLALVVQALFAFVERRVVPEGLRRR